MGKKLKYKKNNRSWASYRARKNAEKIEWEMYQKGGLIEESKEEIHQSYLSLVEKMKQQGIYEEDDPLKIKKSDADRLRKNRLKQTEVSGKRRGFVSKAGRFAAVLCVSVLGVFAVSITSEGNRKYLLDTANYLLGNDVKINLNNEANDENEGKDLIEEKAIDEIEQTMGVEVPYFMYRPDGCEFVDYAILGKGVININYELEDFVINLYINTGEAKEKSGNSSISGNTHDLEEIVTDEGKILIYDIIEEGDTATTHVAQWEYQNSYYQLMSKINREEFDKIIEFMRF